MGGENWRSSRPRYVCLISCSVCKRPTLSGMPSAIPS
jgi:hypothetical protein